LRRGSEGGVDLAELAALEIYQRLDEIPGDGFKELLFIQCVVE